MIEVATFLGVLVILALAGCGLLIAGACSKKRRRKLLLLGGALWAPMVLFMLLQVVFSIFGVFG